MSISDSQQYTFWDTIPEWVLRDLFAVAALAGMLADHETNGEPSDFAEAAYSFADAMLTARSKDESTNEEPSTGVQGNADRGLGDGEDILPSDAG